MPSRAAVVIARLAMATGCSPRTGSRVRTPVCSPNCVSCCCAAGRMTSSDAIRTFFFSFFRRRRPSLAEVVVLPEPCRPTIKIATGGVPAKLRAPSSLSRISTKWSWTAFTTICPGVTLRRISSPVARSVTSAMKSLTTGSATSASSSATRISRMASSTSASFKAPRFVSLSKMPPRRPVRSSNMDRPCVSVSHRDPKQTPVAPVRETRGLAVPLGAEVCLKPYGIAAHSMDGLALSQAPAGAPMAPFSAPFKAPILAE